MKNTEIKRKRQQKERKKERMKNTVIKRKRQQKERKKKKERKYFERR